MSDVRIVWSPEFMSGDWSIVDGQLDVTRALVTATAVALFTHRTADADDVLPDGTSDRRGCWSDYEAAEIWDGWPWGSRLWLLVREKQTEETRSRAEFYIREALDPFVQKRLVASYDLVVEWFAHERLGAEITFDRGPDGAVTVRFETLWDELR
jgi:phage gp46-like protein